MKSLTLPNKHAPKLKDVLQKVKRFRAKICSITNRVDCQTGHHTSHGDCHPKRGKLKSEVVLHLLIAAGHLALLFFFQPSEASFRTKRCL